MEEAITYIYSSCLFNRVHPLLGGETVNKDREETEEVTLYWQYSIVDIVDAFGKTFDENEIKISLTKGTFNKIEWKSSDYNNFKIVAD
ncbi:hypothetical protein [Cytobacillus sp.]|uniref:hypothetical protein n=1 Tax=Cytobacillus sp. TaxID=2675269 RepID=UPI0028BE1244|nr:hypothetical protein [Cytobacillus sp.]